MIDVRKARLSVFIGFLSLILLGIVFYLFRAAATGNLVARWVLFLIFGTLAVILASFGIGYVILLLTKKEGEPVLKMGSELQYKRTTQQPITWIDISQLSQYAAGQQQKQQELRETKPPKRSAKKKRR
ncbi:hypothetical protein HYS50_00790 [Candidatus Woesearchaeota archaeon]|nr:hypothetical protein [Candidatus Woesearchaeota archaeon]